MIPQQILKNTINISFFYYFIDLIFSSMYVHRMKTFSLKREQIKKKWLLIDADKAVLGRLAVISATILRGKNKPEYTPNQDCGDNLIIINSDKVHLTGNKEKEKIYYKHTGFPGGLKETNPAKLKAKNKSADIIKLAIKRMIPRGPLGRKQLSNCKIFNTSTHPLESQKPIKLDISKLFSCEKTLLHPITLIILLKGKVSWVYVIR